MFINLALEIVQERQKKNSRQQNEEKMKGSIQRKENNIEMVDQIKEMFLVTMSHGIIENEIQKLKQSQMDKQAALEQSIKLIQEDTKYFENYDNIKKKEVDQQQILAEEEIKKKKMFEAEYKTKCNSYSLLQLTSSTLSLMTSTRMKTPSWSIWDTNTFSINSRIKSGWTIKIRKNSRNQTRLKSSRSNTT